MQRVAEGSAHQQQSAKATEYDDSRANTYLRCWHDVRRQAMAKRGTRNCSLEPRQVIRRRNKHAAGECTICLLPNCTEWRARQYQPAAIRAFKALGYRTAPSRALRSPYSPAHVCGALLLCNWCKLQGTAWLAAYDHSC